MLEEGAIAAGAFVVIGVTVWLLRRKRSKNGRTAQQRQSRKRHEEAQQRDPPVDIGDVCEFGIEEFSHHHSGDRQAVGKVEGFVVFVEDIPDRLEETDVIRAKILSYNRGQTSATATFVDEL